MAYPSYYGYMEGNGFDNEGPSTAPEQPNQWPHYPQQAKPPTRTNPSKQNKYTSLPFGETVFTGRITRNGGEDFTPQLNCTLSSHIGVHEGHLMCQKNNHITVKCWLKMKNLNYDDSVYFTGEDHQRLRIYEFKVSLSAFTLVNQHSRQDIGLYQYDSKRTKEERRPPPPITIDPPPLQLPSNDDLIEGSCSFERIQFERSTANNRKDRPQEFFTVEVNLLAQVQRPGSRDLEWIKIGQCTSPDLVVRGRGPAEYAKTKGAPKPSREAGSDFINGETDEYYGLPPAFGAVGSNSNPSIPTAFHPSLIGPPIPNSYPTQYETRYYPSSQGFTSPQFPPGSNRWAGHSDFQ